MDNPRSRQLPVEIMPSMSWRKVSALIDLTLVAVIVINLMAVLYLDKYSINYGYWTIHQKWNLLAKLDEPVDWLILGDSSCSQGVMPVIFQEELGEKAVNLCTTGDMGTLGDLWVLEEYIQRNGAPANVLIVHTFDIWHRDFNPVRLGQIPRPYLFWKVHSFGDELMADGTVRFHTFLERYIPLLSQNRSVGSAIKSIVTFNLVPFIAQWNMQADGFVPAYEPKPDIVLAGEKQQVEFVTQNTFEVSGLNDRALRRMVELAEIHDFDIFLANAPVYADLFTHPEYQAYFDAMHAYLQSFTEQSPRFFHITSVMTFAAEQMQNPDHLVVAGAKDYTRWLTEEIRLSGR